MSPLEEIHLNHYPTEYLHLIIHPLFMIDSLKQQLHLLSVITHQERLVPQVLFSLLLMQLVLAISLALQPQQPLLILASVFQLLLPLILQVKPILP